MKNKYKYIIFTLLIATTALQAQNYTQANQQLEVSSFNSQNSQLNFLSTQNIKGNTTSTSSFNGNNIFISQIGEGNVVNSSTSSQTSDIRITQNGNDNITALNLEANTIREIVLQEGNNNSFVDYNVSKSTVDFHSGEIIQRGDNLNIEWYGGNSISEKLKVTQQGNGFGKTILVRSFN